jgi:hypothetical protein
MPKSCSRRIRRARSLRAIVARRFNECHPNLSFTRNSRFVWTRERSDTQRYKWVDSHADHLKTSFTYRTWNLKFFAELPNVTEYLIWCLHVLLFKSKKIQIDQTSTIILKIPFPAKKDVNTNGISFIIFLHAFCFAKFKICRIFYACEMLVDMHKKTHIYIILPLCKFLCLL